MLTTFIAFSLLSRGLGYWWAFVLVLVIGFAIGAATERILIRPLHGNSELNPVIVTIGLLVVFEGLAGAIYGNASRGFPAAFSQARPEGRQHDHRLLPLRPLHPHRRPRADGRHAGPVPLHGAGAAHAGDRPSTARSPGCSGCGSASCSPSGGAWPASPARWPACWWRRRSVVRPVLHGPDPRVRLHGRRDRRPREPRGRAGRRPHLGAVHLLRRRVPRFGPRAARRAGPPRWSP